MKIRRKHDLDASLGQNNVDILVLGVGVKKKKKREAQIVFLLEIKMVEKHTRTCNTLEGEVLNHF